jgi:hypothetical protein
MEKAVETDSASGQRLATGLKPGVNEMICAASRFMWFVTIVAFMF